MTHCENSTTTLLSLFNSFLAAPATHHDEICRLS
jgi:hypothetical protein